MIFLVFVCVFIGVIFKILGILKGPILFVFVLFSSYLLIKGIKEIKQNKGIRKSIFYPRKNLELIDLLKPQLKELKEPKLYKIYDNKILLVNNNGAYLIFAVNYKETIEGKENDEYLFIINGKYRKKVKNILLEMKNLKEKINIDDVYLIINNSCNFNVKTNIKVLKFKYFYYEFMKSEKKYKDEELDDIFQNYCQLLSKKT